MYSLFFFFHFFWKIDDEEEFGYFAECCLLMPSTYFFFYLPEKKKKNKPSKHCTIWRVWPGAVPVKTPPIQQIRFFYSTFLKRECKDL